MTNNNITSGSCFVQTNLKGKSMISKKKAWTKEEDIKLKDLVNKYGPS